MYVFLIYLHLAYGKLLEINISGQIIIFHQARFPWNKGNSLTKPPFGVRSCEVAIIWPEYMPVPSSPIWETIKKTGGFTPKTTPTASAWPARVQFTTGIAIGSTVEGETPGNVQIGGTKKSPNGQYILVIYHLSGQISISPKPELRGFWGSSLIKPPFRVTSADVLIICPDLYIYIYCLLGCPGSRKWTD